MVIVTLREIRKLKKGTELLITKAPFNRLVREVTTSVTPYVRLQAGAIVALQNTSEGLLVEIFQEAQLAALNANRITVMQKYIYLGVRMIVVNKTYLSRDKNGDYSCRM